MKKSKRLMRIAALFLALTLLAGCGGQGNTDQPPKTDGAPPAQTVPADTPGASEPASPANTVLRLSIGEQYAKDQVKSCWSEAAGMLFTSMFSALMKVDEEGQPTVFDLATDYTVSGDHTTYTYTIRDDATWHDGEPFTVDDIEFSVKAMLRASSGNVKSTLKKLEGAEAYMDGGSEDLPGLTASGQTVTFQLAEPFSDFLYNMTLFRPLPKHLLADEDPVTLHTCSFWQHPIGTGPYKFKEFEPGAYIVCDVYDGFYGAKPGIPEIQYMVYGTVQAEAALQNGELAMYSTEDVQTAENLVSKNPDLVSYEMTESIYIRYLTANLTGSDGGGNEKLADPRVREAVFRAIDKTAICEDLFQGGAEPLTTLVPSARPEFNPAATCPEYDMDKAAQLLADAGYDFSQPIRIAYFYDDQATIDAMDVIKYNLEQLGLTVELNYLSGDLISLIYDTRDYDFIYQGLSTMLVSGAYNLHKTSVQMFKILGGAYQETWADMLFRFDTTMPEDRQPIIDELQMHESETLEIYPLWSYKMYQIVNESMVDCPKTFASGRNQERHWEDWSLK